MEWARELAERLNLAVNGEKASVIADYEKMTGKSAATLYKIAAKHGFASERKERADKGSLKSGLTDVQLQWCSAAMQTSARQVKGVILPVSAVLQMAIDNGVIKKGQISEARLQAILREREMNAAALDSVDPSIRMASLHPNHVHIFDASICIQYYLKGGKGLALIDERDFREKKPAAFEKIKNRLFRMVLADHFSHTIYVKYYVAAGENQQITYDFLTSAWRGTGHEKLPFRGVPKFLLMDAGSANIAKGILAMLGRLDIEIPKNMPHNPRRQGSAEVTQNIVERNFEARLRFEPATTIEELNAWATDWLCWWNGERVMRRHGMTRTNCWMTIKQEELRDLPSPEIMHDLYAEPEVERTVRQDNTITFRNEEYRVKHIAGIRPGKKVKVVLRPYLWPEVAVVFDEIEYLVSPVGKLAGGFSADAAIIGEEFKAQPRTTVQQIRLDNDNLAYGEDRKKDAVPFDGTLQVFGHHADKLGNVAAMPRRGTPVEISRTVRMIAIGAFINNIRAEIGRLDPVMNKEIKEIYGATIAAPEAERVIAALRSGEDWRPGSAVSVAL